MSRAWIGTAAFALVGPVFELALVPWLLTGFEEGDGLPGGWLAQGGGGLLLAICLVAMAAAFVAFAREGEGTPSPLLPPRRPVRGGVYRWLRHPMYTAASLGLVGEALLLRRPVLIVAAALYALTMAVMVRFFEEPLLRRRFGERWRSS